jgi:hypothetical protein
MRMIKQKEEALSDLNRYYFGIENGRAPINDEELIVYYASNGGARDFFKKNPPPNKKE